MWHHMADYVANYVLFLASIFIAVIIFYTSAKRHFSHRETIYRQHL